MDSLKSRFEMARRLSETEHSNEDATENEESRVVTAERGSSLVKHMSLWSLVSTGYVFR